MGKTLKSLMNENVSCGVAESPISDFKLNNCYIPNGETYPLCKGQIGNNLCKDCNLYENTVEPYDYD